MSKRGKTIEFARTVAKKKPNVKKALDVYKESSDDEIRRMGIPGWIKDVLIKDKKMSGALKSAEEIADYLTEKTRKEPEKYPIVKINEDMVIGDKLSIDLQSQEFILLMGYIAKTKYGAYEISDSKKDYIVKNSEVVSYIYPGDFPIFIKNHKDENENTFINNEPEKKNPDTDYSVDGIMDRVKFKR